MQSNSSTSINGPSILDLVAHSGSRGRQTEAELPFGSLLEARPAPPAAPSRQQPPPTSEERERILTDDSQESEPKRHTPPAAESAATSDSEANTKPETTETATAESPI